MLCLRCHRRYSDASYLHCPYDGGALVARLTVDQVKSHPSSRAGIVLGGRYRVTGLLGRGAMAHVLLAEDMSSQEPVAVKVLSPRFAKDPEMRQRFLREAKAATLIGHPNIVRIFDTGERSDGSLYLVMEFLFGESLGDFSRRDGAMAPDIALPIAHQIASALSAAHQAGIVHRDVKPDNIFLIGLPGDPYGVRLVDFGLAKLLSQNSMTHMGIVIGTPEYMAPEQVIADACDARTDIYGLGMVMFRMFVGKLPYEGHVDTQLLARQLVVTPDPPSQKNPNVHPFVETIILTATRKHPENRYSTMEAMVADIERVLGDRPGPVHSCPLVVPSDEYRPQTPLSQQAARFFYRQLGLPAPEWQ